MAGYSTTYSGDLTTTIAGKLYAAVKKRIEKNRDKADEEKEELKSATKEAESKVITPTPTPVTDKSGRQYVSRMLGGGVVLKMIQLESKAAQNLQSINEIKAITAQNNKLIVDHNEMLLGKLDALLDIYQKKLAHDKKLADDAETVNASGSGGGAGTAGYVNNILKRPKSVVGNLIKDLLLRRAKSAIGRVIPRRLRARARLFARGPLGRRIAPLARAALRPRAAAKTALVNYAKQGAKRYGLKFGTKALGKTALKSAGKKLPFGIGLGISAVFAAQRLFQKPPDPMGAALELASGAAAFVPGVGTAASLAIDAGIAARDATKDTQKYETGTGLTKRGLAILHGTERVDRVDPKTGLATSLIESSGSQLVSVAMKYARDAKVDNHILPEVSRLPFKIVNIPFSTGIKRSKLKTTSTAFFKKSDQKLSADTDFRTAEEADDDTTRGNNDPSQRPRTFIETALEIFKPKPRGGGGQPRLTQRIGSQSQIWNKNLPANAVTYDPAQGIDASGEPGVDFSYNNIYKNYAAFDGEVVSVGPIAGASGYGESVVIRSTDPFEPSRKFDALYAHFAPGTATVAPGQKVSAGEYIGPVGWLGQWPGGSAAPGAGSMRGPHTSLDFFEPDSAAAAKNFRRLQRYMLDLEGKVPPSKPTIKASGNNGNIGGRPNVDQPSMPNLIAGYGLRPDGTSGNNKPGDTNRGHDGTEYKLVPRPGYGYNQWVPIKTASANTPMVGRGRTGGSPRKPPKVSDKDFAALVAISSLEGIGDQSRVDVAQSIMNRLGDGTYGSTLFSVITADAQYQPAYIDPNVSSGPGTKTSPEWKAITDKKSAIAAMQSYYWRRYKKRISYKEMLNLYESTLAAMKNPLLQAAAAKKLGGRTEFLAGEVKGSDVVRREGYGHNSYFAEYGSGNQLSRGAMPFPQRLISKPKPKPSPNPTPSNPKRPFSWWDFFTGGNRSSIQSQQLMASSADNESIEEGLSVLPIVLNKTVIVERQVSSSSGSRSSRDSSFDPLAYQMSRLAT